MRQATQVRDATSVEKLWAALADSNKLAKWIANNDFKPVIGHRFQFYTYLKAPTDDLLSFIQKK